MRKQLLTKRIVLLLTGVALFCLGFGNSANAQITLPYAENLENEGTGSTGCGATQTFTTIQWSNESNDDVDWVIDINGTGSSNTGPTANGGADHNPGVSGGKYLYIEASGCVVDTAHLLSDPIITTGNEPNIFFEFWYHQYGSQINILILQHRQIVGGNPGPWVNADTLFTPPPGIDQWQQGLYNMSTYIGDTFQIRFRGVTGTSFGSDLALDDFKVYSLFQNDAGVVSIDAPLSPATLGANNVDITIGSYGVDTLDSVSIGWEFNGVAQTPFSWTGALTLNQTQANNTIGSVTITPGIYTLKAWTSLPNGVVDSSNANDTAWYTGCSGAFRGAYTAGGSGADFPDITTMAQLLSSCGIDSHTVITINPGFYAENMHLDHVPGTGPNATLIISGVDTSLVTISGSGGPTVYLDGTDYTTIKNMTIEALGNADNFGVQLRDTASWNIIDSCRILMDQISTSLNDVVGVSASDIPTSSFQEGQNAFWTTVSNNHIIGGEKGIHFEGQSFSRNVGNMFMNNIIENAEDYGFYIDDQDSMMIHNNHIFGLRSTFADGIYCFDIQMFSIQENIVVEAPDWGIYIADGNYSFDGTPTSRGKIINNAISSVSDYAAYFDDFEQTDIWHNTFANSSTFSGACRINDFGQLNIWNNIFYSDGDYAFECDEPITPANNPTNYNLYYSTPGSTGLIDDGFTVHQTLASWQTAVNTANQNSVTGDPVFVSTLDDLMPLAPVANNSADSSLNVNIDVLGVTRGTLPDMGAYEFTPLNDDAALIAIVEPGAVSCGDSNTVITVVIRSLGGDTITNMPIVVDITGDITQQINYTYAGPLTFNEYDTVTVGTINTYNGGRVMMSAWTALTGDQNTTNDTLGMMVSATFIPFAPAGIDGYGCGLDSAWVYGSEWPGVSYAWYANPNDTIPVAMADSFMIPSITAQGTYYLGYQDNADSLSTPFNTNNGAGGNMFDITAINSVTIRQLAGNYDPGTFDVAIYYRTSSHVGNETNPAGWIPLGTATGVVAAGTNQPTLLPITFAVSIPAGQTYGFYVQETSTGNLTNYTNGTSVGNIWAQNADIQILEGVGRSVGTPFTGSVFSPRNWNGIVYYGSSACSNLRTPVSAVSGMAAMVNIGPDSSLCDTSYVLNAGNSGNNIMWSTGSMASSITVDTTGMYYVDIIDTNGCTASDTAMISLFDPITTDLGADTLLCDGASVTLDAGNPGSSYMWSTGDTTQAPAVSTAGTVSVMVTDVNGCTATDTVVISTAVTPSASFNFTQAAGNGLSFDFSDLSTGNPTSWSWDFGDMSGTSSSQNPPYTYSTDGSYTVTLVVSNVCGSDTFTQALTVTYFTDGLGDGFVRVYPNPNNGQFQVDFHKISSDNIRMTLVDVNGRVVISKKVAGNGDFKEEVDLGTFSNGVYLLQLEIDGQLFTKRIVVE